MAPHIMGRTSENSRNILDSSTDGSRRYGHKRMVNARDSWRHLAKCCELPKLRTRTGDKNSTYFWGPTEARHTPRRRDHHRKFYFIEMSERNFHRYRLRFHRTQITQIAKISRVKTSMPSRRWRNMRIQEDSVQKFTVGDHVLVRKPRTDKFSSFYDPVPYQITRIKGPTITASRPGHLITRNVTFFKKISHSDTSPDDMDDDLITPPNRPPEPPPLPARRRYPVRLHRRPPQRFSDFVMDGRWWTLTHLICRHFRTGTAYLSCMLLLSSLH